jgi:hypothetical protein
MHCNKPKGRSTWRLCAGLALAPLAFADAPMPNAQALGVAESVLNFCGPIDPGGADKLRQLVRLLVQGANDQQLARVRGSEEYRKAYDSVVELTGKIDRHDVNKFCSEAPLERR